MVAPWFLTEEGVVSVDFVKNMPITSQYFENMKKVDHMGLRHKRVLCGMGLIVIIYIYR